MSPRQWETFKPAATSSAQTQSTQLSKRTIRGWPSEIAAKIQTLGLVDPVTTTEISVSLAIRVSYPESRLKTSSQQHTATAQRRASRNKLGVVMPWRARSVSRRQMLSVTVLSKTDAWLKTLILARAGTTLNIRWLWIRDLRARGINLWDHPLNRWRRLRSRPQLLRMIWMGRRIVLSKIPK